VVGGFVGDVVGSTEVEVRVDVDVTALVRVVRVGAVGVTLGSSDTLGVVRVPNARSRDGSPIRRRRRRRNR
jgi:hypothetical protein